MIVYGGQGTTTIQYIYKYLLVMYSEDNLLINRTTFLTKTDQIAINLDHSDVDEGEVEVDELEAEHLEGVALLEVGLGPGLLELDQPQRHVLVQLQT